MTPAERKEMLEKLQKQVAELQSRQKSFIEAGASTKDGVINDGAIHNEEIQKRIGDILEQMKKLESNPRFSPDANDHVDEAAKAYNELKPQAFLKMLKKPYLYPQFMDYMKTSMTTTSDAQGGYTVPTDWESKIIGELNEFTSIIPKCTNITQSAPTLNISKLLTDLTMTWTSESTAKTQTKPTFERKQSVLKKLAAIVTMSDELLEDSISDLTGLLTKLVAENIAVEIERVALIGSTVGGDPFNGVYYATGAATKGTQGGANLVYNDLVNTWLGRNGTAQVLSKYLVGAEWYMNRKSLGLVMNLVDGNNRPLWNMNDPLGSPNGNIFGSSVNISDQITNTLGTGSVLSSIIYGNYKNIILANKKGNTGIQVTVTNEGIVSSGTDVSTNLWQQDETGFRFVKRQGILVAIPEAFSVLDDVA